MDTRAAIRFTPGNSKKTRKPGESSEKLPHQEIEWHLDGGRPYFISDDDLVPDDDSNNLLREESVCHNVEENKSGNGYIEYPDAYRPSQELLDRINSQKPQPVHYNEERDLYYIIDDEAEAEASEEAVEDPVNDIQSGAVSVAKQGIFSADRKPKIPDPVLECDAMSTSLR